MKQRKKIGLKIKFIIGITMIGLCITFATVFSGIGVYRRSITGRYNEMAYQVAQVAASYFTDEELAYYADLVSRYENGGIGTEELETAAADSRYAQLYDLVNTLRENMDANDIYICAVDMEELEHYDEEADAAGSWNPLHYILDSYHNVDKRMPLGAVGSFFPEYCKDIADSYYSGLHTDNYFVAKSQFGYTTTALYPIVREGKTVAFAGVEIPMATLQSDTNRFIIQIVVAAVLATAALLLIGSMFMVKTMVAPMKLIAQEAERFVADNNAVSEKLSAIRTNDEIQKLGESLLKMEIEINEYIENLTRVTAEKERIGAELNVATQIQADMLPSIFPAFPERKEFDIYATMTPAKEVGGDFYDFFLIDDDHLALVIADVSGKGVPAALFMVIAKTLIKNRAQMAAGGPYSPAEILGYVNEQLCEGNEAELFVTVWLGILQISTGKGIVANAGHEYPTIRRAGGEYELIKTKHSIAVAAMEGIRFREHTFEMHPGDSLYVYTDGVPEATDRQDELFGTDRMLAALNEDPDARPEQLLHTVKRHIDAFVGEAMQFDDITMLCMHYLGGDDI